MAKGKQLTIWAHKNKKNFGVTDGSGVYISNCLRRIIYHNTGREAIDLRDSNSEVSLCGKWKRVAQVDTEHADTYDNDTWVTVRMTKTMRKKFLEQNGLSE